MSEDEPSIDTADESADRTEGSETSPHGRGAG